MSSGTKERGMKSFLGSSEASKRVWLASGAFVCRPGVTSSQYLSDGWGAIPQRLDHHSAVDEACPSRERSATMRKVELVEARGSTRAAHAASARVIVSVTSSFPK